MVAFFKVLWAALQLIATGARYAAKQESNKAAQQKLLLNLIIRITEQMNAAIQAGHEFDAELHANPDGLLNDDGYKRQADRIRDGPSQH